MKFTLISTFGQISHEDLLILKARNGHIFMDNVTDIEHLGQDSEEIELCKRVQGSLDRCFSMSMYLEGKSWIKECYKVIEDD